MKRRASIVNLVVRNIQPESGRGGWHGGPTPTGAVRGVRAAQAAWAPFPGRKNIWELVLHVSYWKYAVRRRLERALGADTGTGEGRFARGPANWPALPPQTGDRQWRADCALLREEHERLVAVVARVPIARYGEALPGGKRWTIGELILGIAQHDAYHAGQIQMLKRLYSARGSLRALRALRK